MARSSDESRKWSAAHGDNLAWLRRDREYTQAAFAKAIVASIESLISWERGEVTPQIKFQERIAELFKIKVDQLWDPITIHLQPMGRTGGVVFFGHPSARRAAFISKITAHLKNENDIYILLQNFTMESFYYEIAAALNTQLSDDGALDKSEMLAWAQQPGTKSRALLLCAFNGAGDSEWLTYLNYIKDFRAYCKVIIVQAIDPLHFRGYFKKGSFYEMDSVHIPNSHIPNSATFSGAPELFVQELLDELPPCCIRALRIAVTKPDDLSISTACHPRLVEAGLLERISDKWCLIDSPWQRAIETKLRAIFA